MHIYVLMTEEYVLKEENQNIIRLKQKTKESHWSKDT